MPNNQQKKLFFITLKVLIFITLSLLLYKQVVDHNSYKEVADSFKQGLSANKLLILFFLLALMILNWTLEISKWKGLISKLLTIRWLTASKGVAFGIALSLFTPNRVGEFGGRVIALPKKRMPAVVATLLGSFSQIIANLVLGGLGLSLYFCFYNQTDYIPAILLFLWTILAVGLPVIYFNLDIIDKIFFRIPILSKVSILRKLKEEIDVIKLYSRKELLRFLLLSGGRCLVYYFQYWLTLQFFGIEVSLLTALVVIPSIFFVQTVIPSFAILGPVLGGNIALTFLDGFSGNDLGIVSANFLLWFVNLILPASIGLLLFVRHKLQNDVA